MDDVNGITIYAEKYEFKFNFPFYEHIFTRKEKNDWKPVAMFISNISTITDHITLKTIYCKNGDNRYWLNQPITSFPSNHSFIYVINEE